MNERIIAVTITQTGNATTGAWIVEFPFPTRLIGIKASGSSAATSTIAVAGGAVVAATELGDTGDPSWITPDTTPDYAAADTAYTVTLTQSGSPHDDPLIILFFAVGEGGTNFLSAGEAVVCATLMQTGGATSGAWVVEFPFPTRLIGIKASGSDIQNSTIAVAGGATVSATALGDSGDPSWITPDTTPDYAAADVAYTFTLSQGTQHDDPMILAFFAVGEGGSNMNAPIERAIVTTIMQTGNAVTSAWVLEFPFPVRYVGSKIGGSNGGDSTLTLAGGVVDAAADFGDTGDPNWVKATTEPDFCAKDTAITATLTQGATQHDDPMITSVWAVGEG